MRTRPAARLLIIDPEDRILLFRTETAPMDPEGIIPGYWYVPGGGVERGETVEEAARRELWEETGIRDIEIGPCVWKREQVLRFPEIGDTLAQEQFFPIWVPDDDLNFINMVDIEAELMSAHRWWTLEALRLTVDVVFPEQLASNLEPILRREYPDAPLTIR